MPKAFSSASGTPPTLSAASIGNYDAIIGEAGVPIDGRGAAGVWVCDALISFLYPGRHRFIGSLSRCQERVVQWGY
jgi:hypothetical protein